MNGERKMRGLRWVGTALAAVAVAAWSLLVAATPPAGAAAVTVAAGSAEGANGDEVTIPVTFQGGPSIGAVEAVLTYDPAVLEPVGVDAGAAASGSLVQSQAGEGRLAMTLVSSQGVAGDGEMFRARFTVVGEKGATSALRLTDATVWEAEGDGFVVEVTATDGTFTVTGKKAAFPVWIIAVIAAVLLLLLLLLLARRRKGSPPPSAPVAVPAGAPSGPARGPALAADEGPHAAPVVPTAPSGTEPIAQFCPSCGTPRKPGAHFCAKCGNQLE